MRVTPLFPALYPFSWARRKQVDTLSIPNDTRVKHASVETMSPSLSSHANPTACKDERPQQVLRLRWDAGTNKPSDEEECTVALARLRQHCSSETARNLRLQSGPSTNFEIPDPTPVLWGSGVISSGAKDNPLIFEYKAIMDDEQPSQLAPSFFSSLLSSASPSTPSGSSLAPPSSPSPSSTASKLRGVLKSHGIALVREVPTDSAATEALGMKMARHLMSTMMGQTVWGISTENVEPDSLFRDSAYTTGGLPLHTDHAFVSETPGLQVSYVTVQSKAVQYNCGGLLLVRLVVRLLVAYEIPQVLTFAGVGCACYR